MCKNLFGDVKVVESVFLKPGKFYWVTGQGPMKLVQCPAAGDVFVFRTKDGYFYWAEHERIGEEATQNDVDNFIQELKNKGVVKESFVPNWDMLV